MSNNLNRALILYCRAGFEKECAAEIQHWADQRELAGYVRAEPNSAYVLFIPVTLAALARLTAEWQLADLCFARQGFVGQRLADLNPNDRISPLLAALTPTSRYSEVVVETADTDAAKQLLGFCKKFTTPLRQALRRAGHLSAQSETDTQAHPRLHVFFLNNAELWLGAADPARSSPWFMGIPRLKFPEGAPSRSALKLEEALHSLLTPGERTRWLRAGLQAVDLGAAPGGWSWVLADYGLRVTAVDNGALAPQVAAHHLITYARADGFRYRPPAPVDWLVCDIVEQPRRIATLIADWAAQGWCKAAMFNLKLPMKKRYEELAHCEQLIHARLVHSDYSVSVRFKQLYHDREEVTGYLRRQV